MAAAKKKNKSKTEKPPPIDKLLKPAIGIVLAFVGYYFMKGIDIDISRVDVNDELALREVFFGEGAGKNHAILCHTLPPEGSSKKPLPVSSVFQDAMDELVSAAGGSEKAIAQFALMDCEHTLPSGKTILEKFKLNPKKRPTIFVSGKVGAPKQIPDKHLKTGHMLAKLLKGMLEPHAAKIENTKDFKSKCLNRDYCALLLKGATPQTFLKDAFKNLLTSYEDIQFASVDSATMLLIGLEEHLPEFESGKHRFVVFKKISGGMKEGDGRLITSIVPMAESDSDSISYGNMSALINDAKSGKKKAKKLSSLPQVKTRTKKLEKAEKAKRDRSSNKKKEKPKATPGGQFAENDGSKEGRKAERDRRRQEHRKNNPNFKEKTPEELAEMERTRRERMNAESEKWNIGEADAPPEGEYEDEDEEGYSGFEEGDDEGYDTYEVDEDEEEDDEDVLDLD
jgi:hypothetical protein